MKASVITRYDFIKVEWSRSKKKMNFENRTPTIGAIYMFTHGHFFLHFSFYKTFLWYINVCYDILWYILVYCYNAWGYILCHIFVNLYFWTHSFGWYFMSSAFKRPICWNFCLSCISWPYIRDSIGLHFVSSSFYVVVKFRWHFVLYCYIWFIELFLCWHLVSCLQKWS